MKGTTARIGLVTAHLSKEIQQEIAAAIFSVTLTVPDIKTLDNRSSNCSPGFVKLLKWAGRASHTFVEVKRTAQYGIVNTII